MTIETSTLCAGKKAQREVSALTRIVETAEDKNDKLTFASVLSVLGLRGVVRRRTIVAASGGLGRKPRQQRKKMINVPFCKLHFKTMNGQKWIGLCQL